MLLLHRLLLLGLLLGLVLILLLLWSNWSRLYRSRVILRTSHHLSLLLWGLLHWRRLLHWLVLLISGLGQRGWARLHRLLLILGLLRGNRLLLRGCLRLRGLVLCLLLRMELLLLLLLSALCHLGLLHSFRFHSNIVRQLLQSLFQC